MQVGNSSVGRRHVGPCGCRDGTGTDSSYDGDIGVTTLGLEIPTAPPRGPLTLEHVAAAVLHQVGGILQVQLVLQKEETGAESMAAGIKVPRHMEAGSGT